jgi:hypothetical protein
VGMVRALWGGLSGIARAVLATSFLHIQAHPCISSMTADRMDTTLVCRGVARHAVMPPLTPLGAHIKRAQMTCHNGRARSLTTYDHMRALAASALCHHLFA